MFSKIAYGMPSTPYIVPTLYTMGNMGCGSYDCNHASGKCTSCSFTDGGSVTHQLCYTSGQKDGVNSINIDPDGITVTGYFAVKGSKDGVYKNNVFAFARQWVINSECATSANKQSQGMFIIQGLSGSANWTKKAIYPSEESNDILVCFKTRNYVFLESLDD